MYSDQSRLDWFYQRRLEHIRAPRTSIAANAWNLDTCWFTFIFAMKEYLPLLTTFVVFVEELHYVYNFLSDAAR